MLSRRMLIVSVFAMLTTVACGNASFFGGSKKKTVPAPNSTAPTTNPVPAHNNQNNQNPNNQVPAGQNPNVQNPNGQPNTGVIYPSQQYPNGQYPNGQCPSGRCGHQQYPNQQNPGGTYGNCSIPNCQYVPGSKTPSQNPIVVPCTGTRCQQPGQMSINQQTSGSVNFGNGQAITIGAENTAQYFRFEVLTDDTAVNVALSGLSGVEQTTNVFEIYSASERIHVQVLPVSQPTFASSSVTLKKGVYSIVLATTGATRDQFSLTSVSIAGNKSMRGLQSAAYNR